MALLPHTNKGIKAIAYGNKIGKASVTSYCIKFKTLKDIDIDVLKAVIQFGVEATKEKN